METKPYPYPEFIDKLVKLEPHELLGVARLLSVDIYKDDPDPKEPNPNSSIPAQLQNKIPRSGEEVVTDILNKYAVLNRAARRRVYKIMRDATKKGK